MEFKSLVYISFCVISVARVARGVECDDLLDCADMYEGGLLFTNLIKFANVENKFQYKGNKTLFLPSKMAMDHAQGIIKDLQQNKEEVKKAVLYHLTNRNLLASQLQNEMLLMSDDNNQLRANVYTNPAKSVTEQTILGAKIILANQDGKTGVIHIVDRFLYPIPNATAQSLILKTDRFSTFVLAASKAYILQLLTGGNFTVFLPNNAAFSKLPLGKFSSLLDDQEQLKAFVNGHLVNGTFYSEGLMLQGEVTTLAGTQITANRKDGGVVLNSGNATVVNLDVSVYNGVIHEIDSVILPG